MSIKSLLQRLWPTEAAPVATTRTGMVVDTPDRVARLYDRFWTDFRLAEKIHDLRYMDEVDGRVKKIHGRMARATVKGGLQLTGADSTNKRLQAQWQGFVRRLALDQQQKLESDARGLVMEGNLPLQWVLSERAEVVAAIRMPTETIVPQVDLSGRWRDPSAAYVQRDLRSGETVAQFAAWQLTMGRLTPRNFDDLGTLGRPYLDATRAVWRKLIMTEEDLVIRRRERAPLRTAHVLEGASQDELMAYKARIEDEQKDLTTNYYLNKKGGVAAVQGDANLDQIADVSYLLDGFFSGAPAPKGLFGYVSDLSRDVLDDLKRDFFEELDALQETLSDVYQHGFRLQLLLAGIDPDRYAIKVEFSERRTDTPNQRADLALKYQAMGVGFRKTWETAGLDPTEVLAAREEEAQGSDPYPGGDDLPEDVAGGGTVKITPGNRPKGESATTISTRS